MAAPLLFVACCHLFAAMYRLLVDYCCRRVCLCCVSCVRWVCVHVCVCACVFVCFLFVLVWIFAGCYCDACSIYFSLCVKLLCLLLNRCCFHSLLVVCYSCLLFMCLFGCFVQVVICDLWLVCRLLPACCLLVGLFACWLLLGCSCLLPAVRYCSPFFV